MAEQQPEDEDAEQGELDARRREEDREVDGQRGQVRQQGVDQFRPRDGDAEPQGGEVEGIGEAPEKRGDFVPALVGDDGQRSE